MANTYECTNCGAKYNLEQRQCPQCYEWGTVTLLLEKAPKSKRGWETGGNGTKPISLTEIKSNDQIRIPTGIPEFDRVLGGNEIKGLVPGEVILLVGPPGIGKSTLLLSVAHTVASQNNGQVLYCSAEESPQQISLRAKRMNIKDNNLKILGTNELNVVIDALTNEEKYNLVVFDSLQSFYDATIEGTPGGLTQTKEIALQLVKIAKERSIPIIIVGHVTKGAEDGKEVSYTNIAGGMVINHIVDCVISLQQTNDLRLLKGIKNRFGAADEIGIFIMEEKGMRSASNPEKSFCDENTLSLSGNILTVVSESARPLLIEVQALVNSAENQKYAQRSVTGYEITRLRLVIAVLNKHLKNFSLNNKDIHINIVNGLQAADPTMDCSIAAAIYTSKKNIAPKRGLCIIGELGLSGEIRKGSRMESKVKTAIEMEIPLIVIPKQNIKLSNKISKSQIIEVENLATLITIIEENCISTQ